MQSPNRKAVGRRLLLARLTPEVYEGAWSMSSYLALRVPCADDTQEHTSCYCSLWLHPLPLVALCETLLSSSTHPTAAPLSAASAAWRV